MFTADGLSASDASSAAGPRQSTRSATEAASIFRCSTRGTRSADYDLGFLAETDSIDVPENACPCRAWTVGIVFA